MSVDHRSDHPRVLGNREHMDADAPQISPWTPPSPAAVAALPPLPSPPARPALPVPERPEPAKAPGSTPGAQAADATPPPRVSRSRPAWIHDDTVQALIWERPEEAARVVRSLLVHTVPEGDLPSLQRIAILFVRLGQELAAEIMKFLSDYEIEEITQSVANLRSVSAQMQAEVLTAFEAQLRAGDWVDQGGVPFARGALERAVGPRKAKEILDRVASVDAGGFAVLKNATPEELAPFIAHEHPQTIALLLSQLNPQQGAGILDLLPSRLQAEVSYRIATMQEVTPAVMNELAEAIASMLRDIIGSTRAAGGPKVLADLLNLASQETEAAVLDDFDENDEEIAEAVRQQMFTFADIGQLSAADLATVMQEADPAELAVALKAVAEPLKKEIQACVGAERWQQLTDAMEQLGPMRASEVELAQLRILQFVRRLEEQGRITVTRAPDDNPLI